MGPKRALITGASGQDGAYLSKLLLEKGYEVFGAIRRNSHHAVARLERLGIADHVHRVDLDLVEVNNVVRVIREIEADEIYNLAAHSFVGSSWEQPLYVGDVNGLGVTRLLDAIRTYTPQARFYQASTSELFGRVREVPQTELTPFHPRSPYGVAKAYAHYITVNYRESFGAHASCGILFNHESPLRGEEFVTRKITRGLVNVKLGRGAPVAVGNLDAMRDWGFAGDYVEGMWTMVQQDVADDYVLATGESISIRDFTHHAAVALDFDPVWAGEGLDETCHDRTSGKLLVEVNRDYFRPAEVEMLVGDATKAREKLGWKPTVLAPELAEMMALADLKLLS